MNEILQTEKSYVRFLADLVNVQNQKKKFSRVKKWLTNDLQRFATIYFVGISDANKLSKAVVTF